MPVLLALLFCALSAAQPRPEYFKPADMMTIGVYYYPEAWPEAQWPRDMQNIGKLGMEFVHMGEFAWAFMEPQEGKYDFAWLERNVQLAAKNNLKVILCTPSAAPPIWASRKYPDILMVDSRGRRMNHGSREHACWSVPKYREMVARVNTELAKRFGNNPAVWGWQLDNELSHYGKKYCYCRFCTAKFRAWLEGKYFTIAELNRDWGNAFWSQMYQSFDQIEIPNPDELVAQENPHALLDFQRWFASEAAGYLREQAETLRRYTKNQWITTNFMAMHKEVNPALSAKDLEAITWTDYPVHGDLNEGPLGFRMGDAYPMSFMHDFARPMTGIEGLMELQPGQVNWGTTNPWPYPGAIRMWIHRAFAAGARLVCTYRYRQPLSGSELYHKGLAETDGVTPSPGGREYAQAMREIAELRKEYTPQAVEPREYAAPPRRLPIQRREPLGHRQPPADRPVEHRAAHDALLQGAETARVSGGRHHRGRRPGPVSVSGGPGVPTGGRRADGEVSALCGSGREPGAVLPYRAEGPSRPPLGSAVGGSALQPDRRADSDLRRPAFSAEGQGGSGGTLL